jgi:hypothetical protein
MTAKRFRIPIVIYAHIPRRFVLINSMEEASRFLFDNWPDNDSKAWSDAMQKCDGDGEPADASEAFLAALQQAGIAVDKSLRLY